MKDFVFCVDSDGCAMDTMTYKHQLFFGPIAVDVFEIEDRERFLAEWDRINLYSKTRGVNRFIGLVMALEFAGKKNIAALKNWVETAGSLSNASLKAELSRHPSDDLQKALDWSNEVNRQIESYDGDALAFCGAVEGLEKLHTLGKVYVVSSANKEAVKEEWTNQGLMPYVDDLYCQDRGKKEDVIAELINQGYDPGRIMMIGDSPGDLKAAEQTGVVFYPILVGQEVKSWEVLKKETAEKFIVADFSTAEQEDLKKLFWNHLV